MCCNIKYFTQCYRFILAQNSGKTLKHWQMSFHKVFAKAPGFTHWPGFIVQDPPDYVFSENKKSKDTHFCVFFFDSWLYHLFPKLDQNIEAHIRKSDTTIDWNENYEKFLKMNQNKKKYLSALEQGHSWSNEEILVKFKSVTDEHKRVLEKKEDSKKQTQRKPVKRKAPSEPPTNATNVNKRQRKPKDSLTSLIKIKTYLDSKIFTFPNNNNIPIEQVKTQIEKLKNTQVNFEILKESRIGKMVKKISKLTETDKQEQLPPPAQIELLVTSGVIKECQELVALWTDILSN